uniref:ANK_REP_REGION domain-containing protein n=1 Tax=Heterorhabditis bacteriophora TaxID=37862 RepID=A0A1I7WWY9_HETBA
MFFINYIENYRQEMFLWWSYFYQNIQMNKVLQGMEQVTPCSTWHAEAEAWVRWFYLLCNDNIRQPIKSWDRQHFTSVSASLDGPESRECAMMLLKSGGQPDVAQENGETCLHIAARNGNKDIMRHVLGDIRAFGNILYHVYLATSTINFKFTSIIIF